MGSPYPLRDESRRKGSYPLKWLILLDSENPQQNNAPITLSSKTPLNWVVLLPCFTLGSRHSFSLGSDPKINLHAITSLNLATLGTQAKVRGCHQQPYKQSFQVDSGIGLIRW